MTDEFDWIARLTPRQSRAFAKAIGSGQTTFDGQAEPTADNVHSITRVTDAPVQILGRITPDGIWLITSCYVVAEDEDDADAAEVAIAKSAGGEPIVFVDGIAETMIRFVIPRVLANLAPGEAREDFKRRLAASRFADHTIH